MAEEKNKPEQKPSKGKTPNQGNTQAPLDSQGFQKAVNEALQTYMRALKDVYNKSQKRSEELYQEYLKAQREQQIVADENLKEDYRNYVGSMQQVWGQEDAQSKMADANREFLTAINDRQFELRNSLEGLYKNYLETVQKNITQTQQDYSAGYQDFLKSFQSAWVVADVTSLDTGTLASVAQILITASNCAGQTIPVM